MWLWTWVLETTFFEDLELWYENLGTIHGTCWAPPFVVVNFESRVVGSIKWPRSLYTLCWLLNLEWLIYVEHVVWSLLMTCIFGVSGSLFLGLAWVFARCDGCAHLFGEWNSHLDPKLNKKMVEPWGSDLSYERL